VDVASRGIRPASGVIAADCLEREASALLPAVLGQQADAADPH